MKLLLVCVFIALAAAQVFFDVGSSGTKVFAARSWADMKPASAKGSIAAKDPNHEEHLGLAAAAFADAHHGHAPIQKPGKGVAPIDAADGHHVEAFMEAAFDVASEGGAADGSSVIALATAGMRVPEVPEDAMAQACNLRPGHNFRMVGGKWCRITPGTDEAFFEWIALQTSKSDVGGRQVHATGGVRAIVSMGGASAQIAIPLDATTLTAWNHFMEEAHTHRADWFHPGTHPTQGDGNYERNFIDVKLAASKDLGFAWSKLGVSQFPGTTSKVKGKVVKRAGRPIVGVGVISFLALSFRTRENGLAGSHKHIAGGINAMDKIIKDLLVNTDRCANWADCLRALKDELMHDPWFAAVMDFIHANHLESLPWALISNMDVLRSARGDQEAGFCNSAITNKGAPKRTAAKCVAARTARPACAALTTQRDCQRDRLCKWLVQGASAKGVQSMSRKQFAECTEQQMVARLNGDCGTKAQMQTAEINGKAFNKCSSSLTRVAIAQLLFGNNQRGADLVLATGGPNDGVPGDPMVGAVWVFNQQQPAKGANMVCSAVRTSPSQQAAANSACAALKNQRACVANRVCRWALPAKVAPKSGSKALSDSAKKVRSARQSRPRQEEDVDVGNMFN